MKQLVFFLVLCLFSHLYGQQGPQIYIHILGIAQDGGYPHAGCQKNCCVDAWKNKSLGKYVCSFALVDSISKKWWLFEATPDIKFQLNDFHQSTKGYFDYLPAGIFLTHAHIGHYTGLMHLGKEVMGTKEMPVYVLPKMKSFLENNGPWSQLVALKNIVLKPLSEDSVLSLTSEIQIRPFTVPHRDEFSETAGFKILSSNKKYLFIPDIDKWEKWKTHIVEAVRSVDFALIDATFYANTELPNRALSGVPHPLVTETMDLFSNEEITTKVKIYFIHFNHMNPLLWDKGKQLEVEKSGFHLAEQGARL